MKLFLKVSRLGKPRRVLAWVELRGSGLGPSGIRMSEAESGEFEYAMNRGKFSTVGAGGQYQYSVLDRLADIRYPYAIVRPTSDEVRKQYPDTCRVVNVKTGDESMLCHNLDAALDIIASALAKNLRGSFS